jgi:Uma2 family endonuclease
MADYRRLGVRLGLLVNPQNQSVEIYRLGQAVVVVEAPRQIDCSEVMPGFVLRMDSIW